RSFAATPFAAPPHECLVSRIRLSDRQAPPTVGCSATSQSEGKIMALEKGITRSGEGFHGKTWNILGQVYFPKAVTESTFAFETNSEPGQFVPVHVHPTQEEFILVQEGVLDLKLDGVWVQAKAGDLVRMPRAIPHGFLNNA